MRGPPVIKVEIKSNRGNAMEFPGPLSIVYESYTALLELLYCVLA